MSKKVVLILSCLALAATFVAFACSDDDDDNDDFIDDTADEFNGTGEVINDTGEETNGTGDEGADEANEFTDSIICGEKTCVLPGETCCQGLTSARCVKGGCTPVIEATAKCDGPEDCHNADKGICCARFPEGTSCSAACAGTKTAAILCHGDEDCDAPNSCMLCKPSAASPATNMCVEKCPS